MMKTKTVVITGSARGLGYEMAKCFRKKNYNVVISDLNKKDIDKAKKEILSIKGKGEVLALVCDITKAESLANYYYWKVKGDPVKMYCPKEWAIDIIGEEEYNNLINMEV